jgi:hypothetical protein
MKISFDFDNTLSKKWVQEIAKAMVAAGHDVYVTTARREIDSTEVFAVTDELGIARKNCQFTHYADKLDFVRDFDVHFDDDDYEVDLINRDECNCRGVLLGFINWRGELLQENKFDI